jgi:hypothetical protein
VPTKQRLALVPMPQSSALLLLVLAKVSPASWLLSLALRHAHMLTRACDAIVQEAVWRRPAAPSLDLHLLIRKRSQQP